MRALLLACLACTTPKAGASLRTNVVLHARTRRERGPLSAEGCPAAVRREKRAKEKRKKEGRKTRRERFSAGCGRVRKVDRVTHKKRLMHIMNLHTTTASTSINTDSSNSQLIQIYDIGTERERERNTHVHTHICVCVCVHVCIIHIQDTYVQRDTGMHTGRGCERNTSTYAPANNANRTANQLHGQKRRSRAFRSILQIFVRYAAMRTLRSADGSEVSGV